MPGRLTRAADFERVRNEGARWRGRFCTLNAARALLLSDSGVATAPAVSPTRAGLITAKRIGGAVRRNRARRLLREALRALGPEMPAGWDLVLIAAPAISDAGVKMQDVREDIAWLLKKIPAPDRPTSNRPL